MDGVRVTFSDAGARQVFSAAPRIANQEINKAYRRYASEFGKFFSGKQLRAGVFNPKRKATFRRPPRGQPSLPVKMRKAGFVARLTGTADLNRKSLVIRTSNPLLRIREVGGTIQPRKGKYLFIRGRFRGRGASARQAALEARLNPGHDQRFRSLPIVAKVRSVSVPPVLRFRASHRQFHPARGVQILRRAVSETVRRLNSMPRRRFAA